MNTTKLANSQKISEIINLWAEFTANVYDQSREHRIIKGGDYFNQCGRIEEAASKALGQGDPNILKKAMIEHIDKIFSETFEDEASRCNWWAALDNKDKRPARGHWAPGNYANKCCMCEQGFPGHKHAIVCADCEYKKAEE